MIAFVRGLFLLPCKIIQNAVTGRDPFVSFPTAVVQDELSGNITVFNFGREGTPTGELSTITGQVFLLLPWNHVKHNQPQTVVFPGSLPLPFFFGRLDSCSPSPFGSDRTTSYT